MSAVTDLARTFGHPLALELDDKDAFPEQAFKELDDFGLNHYYVPKEYGGRLTSFEELLGLLRVVARHDLTVAIAHAKTLLGAISVWVSGDPAQAAWLGGRIVAGDLVSWGLSEREHGSDLLSGGVTAVLDRGTYRIDGEKWPINNAARGDLMTVLARTDAEGGPRGFDLVLVDRRHLAPGSYRCLPKELTRGIRGVEISGVVYTGALVPESARVGAPGTGVETVLKGLQISRTVCAALALGGAEHALRLTVGPAFDLAPVRHDIAGSYADLLAMEAMTIVCARAVHVLPAELSVLSSVTKYAVPVWAEDILGTLARLFGRSAVQDPMFVKLTRDVPIVGLFDGSTVVNLSALINQFPTLAKERPGVRSTEAYDVRAPLPAFDPARLALLSLRGLSILDGLPGAVGRLPAGGLAERGGRLLEQLAALRAELRAFSPGGATGRGRDAAERFEAAARLTSCVVGAAVIEVWLANRNAEPGGLWAADAWPAAALDRVLYRLGDRSPEDPARDGALCGVLQDQIRSGRPISLFAEAR